MADRTIEATITLKFGPAANWVAANPVLSRGEMGLELDTGKYKVGDGAKTWSALAYGTAGLAEKWKTARTLTLTGEVTGSISMDGSANVNLLTTLANSGVTAGAYPKVTVDAKGRVTSGAALATSDIPSLPLSKITDAGTAASKNTGTAAGNVPLLDGSGKLDIAVIPALAISDTFVVASQTAMLALTAQAGDIAVRTDTNATFILAQSPASTLANWQQLLTPTSPVLSVNGKTGAITLTTSDVAEGTNKYYTDSKADARADVRFNALFPAKSVTALSDGANVMMATDTWTINGGEV